MSGKRSMTVLKGVHVCLEKRNVGLEWGSWVFGKEYIPVLKDVYVCFEMRSSLSGKGYMPVWDGVLVYLERC